MSAPAPSMIIWRKPIVYPPGFHTYVARGISGHTFLTEIITKMPASDEQGEADIAVERRIYERLQERGGHEGLLHYYGPIGTGILLEYASNRNLIGYLMDHPDTSTEVRLRWASEIIAALSFLHDNDVIHCDLCLNNVMLSGDLRAKLADFSGSSIDKSEPLILVSTTHRYEGQLPSIYSDLFAFGSTLFEIMAGRRPYAERSEVEIETLYAKGEFADTSFLGQIGVVIRKYWKAQYESASEVLNDIKGIRQSESSTSANGATAK